MFLLPFHNIYNSMYSVCVCLLCMVNYVSHCHWSLRLEKPNSSDKQKWHCCIRIVNPVSILSYVFGLSVTNIVQYIGCTHTSMGQHGRDFGLDKHFRWFHTVIHQNINSTVKPGRSERLTAFFRVRLPGRRIFARYKTKTRGRTNERDAVYFKYNLIV